MSLTDVYFKIPKIFRGHCPNSCWWSRLFGESDLTVPWNVLKGNIYTGYSSSDTCTDVHLLRDILPVNTLYDVVGEISGRRDVALAENHLFLFCYIKHEILIHFNATFIVVFNAIFIFTYQYVLIKLSIWMQVHKVNPWNVNVRCVCLYNNWKVW